MTDTLPTEEALRTALAELLDGLPPRQAGQAVERLISHYRGAVPTDTPVLRDRSDVAAYAAYRMPATFAAVRASLGALADAAPRWTPGSHLDVGGGTGAAVWAAAATWDGPRTTTVLDWSQPALAIGRELAAGGPETLRAADWRPVRITAAPALPESDLITLSYLLNELTDRDRNALIAETARAGQAVVIVEPGTPDGYLRIIEARDQLIAAGLRIVAPCPHSGACPIERGADWCHFGVRVSRSSLHRQVKSGSLPYEDEKFSYVAAVRFDADPADARVIRRPQIRKGQVLLELCTADDGLRRETVSKRHGTLYRAARNTSWGDIWPPDEESPDAAHDGDDTPEGGVHPSSRPATE